MNTQGRDRGESLWSAVADRFGKQRQPCIHKDDHSKEAHERELHEGWKGEGIWWPNIEEMGGRNKSFSPV
jgi:hypothetical protein